MFRTIAILTAIGLSAGAGLANPIERACLTSGRAQASPALCGCIGLAAELTLGPSDQRTAARLFDDPQRAQDIRMSNRPRDDRFWERYTAFGQVAEEMCS